MTKDQPPVFYQDTYLKTPTPLRDFARYRVTHPSPLLGDTVCSAAQFTFAIWEEDGRRWHNPSPKEKQELIQAVVDTGQCCRNLGKDCWARRNAA